jgi:hypothetical protein
MRYSADGGVSAPRRTDSGTFQSSARPINRYQEVPFIVIKKHRQFHVGVGAVTAILVFTRRVVEDIALPTAAMGRNTCANQRPHLVLR